MNTIGQLLPVDGYFVRLYEVLPENYFQSLSHLYQPLIGPEATMLYQTLYNEITLQDDIEPQTHHTLMNYTTLPLDRIYEARLKLEAIGLMKTYKQLEDGATRYTYELQCPYDPASFFQDAMLSTLLYHHIGEQKFQRLQTLFKQEEYMEAGENVTADFQEVFNTFPRVLQAGEVSSETAAGDTPQEEPDTVDFTWLEQMLKQRMIPISRVLSKVNKKLISQMLIIYDLESFEIDKAVIWSLNEENYLDPEEFKQACHDIYRAKNNNKPIRLVDKAEKSIPRTEVKQPLTKEEMLIRELEKISPKQLLEDLSSGNFASEQDMKLISDVMTTQGLPAPVMNVLIHYVLLQTNMKLSRAYLEKIASHWSRARLKTAREAMMFAKKEKENYEKAKVKRTTGYQRAVTKDIIPDWYKEGKHKEKPTNTEPAKMNEEQWKVAQLLKQYSEGN